MITHCRPTAQLPEKPKRPPQGSPSTRAHTLQHLQTHRKRDQRERGRGGDVLRVYVYICVYMCVCVYAQNKYSGVGKACSPIRAQVQSRDRRLKKPIKSTARVGDYNYKSTSQRRSRVRRIFIVRNISVSEKKELLMNNFAIWSAESRILRTFYSDIERRKVGLAIYKRNGIISSRCAIVARS